MVVVQEFKGSNPPLMYNQVKGSERAKSNDAVNHSKDTDK